MSFHHWIKFQSPLHCVWSAILNYAFLVSFPFYASSYAFSCPSFSSSANYKNVDIYLKQSFMQN